MRFIQQHFSGNSVSSIGRGILITMTLCLLPIGCQRSAESPVAMNQESATSSESIGTQEQKQSSHSESAKVVAEQTISVSTQAALPTTPGSSFETFHQPFEDNLAKVDPSLDGWNTEAFSDQVSKQLKQLESVIAKWPNDRDQLGPFLAEDFRCTPLRPATLKTVFKDPSFQVRRQQAADGKLQSIHQGAGGLGKAIDDLRSATSHADVHVHFKTIRVNLDAEFGETVSYFQLGGTTTDQGVQQTAVWTCRWERNSDTSPPRLHEISVEQFEETVSGEHHTGMFRDATEATLGATEAYQQQLVHGVDTWVLTMDRRLGLDIVATHGLAVGDIDGDGLEDLYVCEAGGLPNRLFLHKADGTARDVSAVAGVDYMESTRSALFIDLDNDGDQDLVIASDRYLLFLSNDGYGRFYQRAGFRTESSLVSMAAADYDLDGDLDIYACGYFTMEDAAETSVGLGNPIPFHDANNGARNSLFQNNGNWTFADVTDAVGLDADNERFSLAASWEDYDNDGDPDLYVANDYGRNCLYRNDQGQFKNVAAEAGVEDISAGMSISWGDYNRDGLQDIYISNMFSSAGNRISYQRQFKTDANDSTRSSYQRFSRGNTLFENAGDGTFRDVTLTAGVTLGRWAWGSNFIDINNDGWEDLMVTNGMLTRDGQTPDL